ncbi:MAG: hypothetical protein GX338_02885 [Firmicutes bacterium]|nr:hypothetical protein [Bacillota bacterium]
MMAWVTCPTYGSILIRRWKEQSSTSRLDRRAAEIVDTGRLLFTQSCSAKPSNRGLILNQYGIIRIETRVVIGRLNMAESDDVGLMDIVSTYVPLRLLGERQMTFIKYLGTDLGYDWE